jgi:tetratricopeptide (TPR) repeat protein
VDRALQLDARNADALSVKGDLLHFRFVNHLVGDPATAERTLVEAESALVQAVRVNPNKADAWATLSAIYYRKPDLQAVVHAAYQALRADKYLESAQAVHSHLFYARYNTEDFAGALTTCDEGRRRFPSDPRFVQCRLFLYLTPRAGPPNPDSAWVYAARMVDLSAPAGGAVEAVGRRELARRRADVLVAGALATAGLPDSARRVLDRARPDAALDPKRTVIGWEAAVRLMLGEKDRAVDLLRDYLVVNPEHKRGFAARTSWWWRDIQDHPRFRALIAGD